MKTLTFSAFDETKTLAEWTQDSRCVVGFETLRRREQRGWTLERALTIPAGDRTHLKRSEKSHVNIGALKKGGEGKHQTHAKVEFAIPQRLTNSSSKHPYTPPAWNVRAGADQHLAFRSLTS